jgi:dynein light chain 1
LGRNSIKKIEGLEAVSNTLEELWLSYNMIEKLNGIECCKKLKILYMSNNKIKDWGALAPAVITSLQDGSEFGGYFVYGESCGGESDL